MRFLDFYATWCGPCKKMEPILESLADDHPDLEIVKIDVDEQPQMMEEYAIVSVPTYILVDDDGETVSRVTGAMPKAVLKLKLGLS